MQHTFETRHWKKSADAQFSTLEELLKLRSDRLICSNLHETALGIAYLSYGHVGNYANNYANISQKQQWNSLRLFRFKCMLLWNWKKTVSVSFLCYVLLPIARWRVHHRSTITQVINVAIYSHTVYWHVRNVCHIQSLYKGHAAFYIVETVDDCTHTHMGLAHIRVA